MAGGVAPAWPRAAGELSEAPLFSADSLALGQRRQLGGRYEDGLQRQKQPPLTGLPHSRQLFLDSHNSPAVLFAFEKAV